MYNIVIKQFNNSNFYNFMHICDQICERDLPHTYNSINLEDHNLVSKKRHVM